MNLVLFSALDLLGLVIGVTALVVAARRNGLRSIHFGIAGGIGYVIAWAIGGNWLSPLVGAEASLGMALAWVAACYGVLAFLKSTPLAPEKPRSVLVATGALGWRAMLAVVLACLFAVIANYVVLFLAGFLGASTESEFLYSATAVMYVGISAMLSFVLLSRMTRNKLAAVHSALVPILRQKAGQGHSIKNFLIIIAWLVISLLSILVLDPSMRAGTYGTVGIICDAAGWSGEAESMYQKSLAKFKELGNRGGMAVAYRSLGGLYETLGSLDKAEMMLNKSLAIYEDIGEKQDAIIHYDILGRIYLSRGNLAKAETMATKSLALNETVENQEGMARDYDKLGSIHQSRGEFDKAEEMFDEARRLFETLRDQEGMAMVYNSLGIVYLERANLDSAEVVFKQSLALYESLNSDEDVALAYLLLGTVYAQRGELAEAEAMFQEALGIGKSLEDQVMMAAAYGSLGEVYQERSDIEDARTAYKQAVMLFQAMGADSAARNAQAALDGLNLENH